MHKLITKVKDQIILERILYFPSSLKFFELHFDTFIYKSFIVKPNTLKSCLISMLYSFTLVLLDSLSLDLILNY